MRHRHHTASTETLQATKQKKCLKIPGHSAEHRAHSEQTEADKEESLAAKAVSQKTGRSDNNGIGDEIGGYHPGRFVFADAQAARNIIQRDIGDRGVENLHERGQCYHDGNQPRIDGFRRCGCCVFTNYPIGAHECLHRWSIDAVSRSYSEGSGLMRTLGTTDIPGPTATSAGGLSMMIFTVTRWMTFTKLPRAFSAGSR